MSNKIIVFNNEIIDKSKNKIITEIFCKELLYEGIRIYNKNDSIIELIFSMIYKDDTSKTDFLQISFLMKVDNIDSIYDNTKILLSDFAPKFYVATNAIKDSDYLHKFNYYLQSDSSQILLASFNLQHQLLISKVLNSVIQNKFIDQSEIFDELALDIPAAFIKINYNPDDKIIIDSYYFKRTKINSGNLYVLFTLNNLKDKQIYFLVSIHIKEFKKIKNLVKKNKYKKYNDFCNYIIESLNKTIISVNDGYKVDYLSKLSLNKTIISKTYFIDHDLVISIFEHEKYQILEKIVDELEN